MKKISICLLLVLLVLGAALEIIPPRRVIHILTSAVREQNAEVIGWYFVFNPEKHGKLTPLNREEQLALLTDIHPEDLKFKKDDYAVDEGRRFTVYLTSPKKLEFEMETIELPGKIGPAGKFVVTAIRESAKQSREI